MPIAFPEPTPAQGPDQSPRRPDERDRARTRTREEKPATEGAPAGPDTTPETTTGGQLVQFPGGGEVDRIPGGAALAVWWTEARQTASRAIDGSVYSARPPSMRDSITRLRRAEWAGEVAVLRWLGWGYGAPAQVVRCLLMCLLWLLDHPSRLLVAAGVTFIALYLH